MDEPLSIKFAALAYELRLVENPARSFLFSKTLPAFSFIPAKAIKLLCASPARPSIRRIFKAPLTAKESVKLLNQCIQARLVHSPSERALLRANFAPELQITAKGVCALHNFCDEFGLHESGAIQVINSAYNTMVVYHLERDAKNKLLMSNDVGMVLYNKMMGTQPNVYEVQTTVKLPQSGQGFSSWRSSSESDKQSVDLKSKSPYYHKFFSHPSSRAVMQYHDSTGVRVFRDLSFSRGNNTFSVGYVVSGKAMWQWMMECTSVTTAQEAMQLVQLIISHGLLLEITDPVLNNVVYEDELPRIISRNTLYTMTENGVRLCSWNPELIELSPALSLESASPFTLQDENTSTQKIEPIWANLHQVEDTRLSTCFSEMVDLSVVKRTPGLKMLLREYLSKEARAIESFVFIEDYEKLLEVNERYQRALATADTPTATTWRLWMTEFSHHLAKKYMSAGAFELNISHDLRLKVCEAVESDKLVSILKVLECVCQSCEALLGARMLEFANYSVLDEIPIKNYVVAKVLQSPATLAVQAPIYASSRLTSLCEGRESMKISTCHQLSAC